MKTIKTELCERKKNIFARFSDTNRLKQLIIPANFYNLISFEDFDITVQQKSLDNGISGFIKLTNSEFLLSKTYFQITLNQSNTLIPKTIVYLTISDEPFTFTSQYQKQEKQLKQSQSRNLNRIAMVAAIALVAVTIPAMGILAPGILDDGKTTATATTLSETEGLLYLSENSNDVGNHRDAIYYGDKVLQDNQVSIPAAVQIREAYSNLEKYDSLLPQKTSLITIESSDSVMFYPDKDGAGYAIPKESGGSFKLDYPGDIPIIYPTNGKYPIVIFNEDSNYPPTIISPDSPNYLKILSSSSQDKSIVEPILRVDPEESNITYAETPIGSTNDPLVVYPYGFGEDVPVIVFPNQGSAATTLTNNYAPRENYLVYGEQTTVTSTDLVPIEYTEISLNDIENIQNDDDNNPVRVSSLDGSSNLSVEFPLGIDSRPLINYVPSSVGATQNTGTSNTGTTTNIAVGTGTTNPTFVVTTSNGDTGSHDEFDLITTNPTSVVTTSSGDTGGGFAGGSGRVVDFKSSGVPDYYGFVGIGDKDNQSIPNDSDNGSDIPYPVLLAWSEENYEGLSLIIAQGDPNIFTINDSIEPCTVKMHPDQDDSYHWKFDLFATDIPLKMDRTLCDGTYMMFVDFNGNGMLDDGYEALWHTDYTTYQIMHIIDYEKGNDSGNHNGRIDVNDDDIWKDVMVMDSNYQTYRPSELGITGFDYLGEIIMADDDYGTGQYADIAGVAEKNFRIVSWNPQGLIFDDGTTRPTYGALQGPLLDCTIYDARYMIAEKHLSEWELDTAMNLYEEGLEYCQSMEFTSEDPDKLLSHWVAGIASYYHRDGQLEEAKPYYEESLEMSPDRHFYLTDYALLLDQLGYDADITLPIVEQALEIDPEHGYAKTVKARILS